MLSKRNKAFPLRDVTNSKNTNSTLMPYRNVAIGRKVLRNRKNAAKSAILPEVLPNDSQTNTKTLRQRKIHNYREPSVTSSTSNENESKTNTKHVPIYLKNRILKETRTKIDPFEFVAEPSFKKHNKNDHSSDSDSIIYDRTMKEILDEIVHKEEQKEKQQIRKNVPKKKVTKKIPETVLTISPPSHIVPSTSTPKPTSPLQKVNIISNILVPPAASSSPLLPHSRPPSSVDLGESFPFDFPEDVKDSQMQPWRGDNLNLRRNPYWLALKNSSLPFYNQDMILEQELIKRLPPAKPLVNKESNLVQTQLLDFIRSETPPRINNRSTLFDDSDLSPIKCNEKDNHTHESEVVQNYFGFSDNDEDKENTPPSNNSKAPQQMALRKRQRSKIGSGWDCCSSAKSKETIRNKENMPPSKNTRKRTKLTPSKLKPPELSCLNKESILFNTLEETSNINQTLNAENYFGFDYSKDDNQTPIKKDVKALPLRFSTRDLKKLRSGLVEQLVVNTVTDDVAFNESLPETADTSVRLFQDLEPQTPVQRTYVSKRRKKTLPSVPYHETHADAEEKSKKKRKDIRTPAEEEEFNKWASRFNAMCDEIDQHALEISNI